MKAVVKTGTGAGNVSLMDCPNPQPKCGEVVIRVMAAGVCGTDVKILNGQAWCNPPVILGHEFAGIVEAVGDGVEDITPGMHVVSETAQVVCGVCAYCRSGRALMCKKRLSIGYGVDGAFAEFIAVRRKIVHKIPDSLGFETAALCEPFAVALHGVWDGAHILPTDTVLVTGPGAVGQLAAQAAKLRGAKVILAGTVSDGPRLKIARELGIEHTMLSMDRHALMELTEGRGVDVVIECTGAQMAIQNAMQALRPTGKLVQIGLTQPSLTIEYSLLTAREISLCGSFGHMPHNWEQAISLLASGRVQAEKLVENRYPLEEWEQAFAQMQQHKGIKTILYPGYTVNETVEEN